MSAAAIFALDSIGGTGLARLLLNTHIQTPVVALVAVGLWLLAGKVDDAKAPWPPLVVLLAFGWQLETAHASPHGPIAFALLIVAAIWLWWAERNAAHRTFSAEDLRG